MVGTLSVGAVPLAVMLLVPEAARTFGRDFPGVKLRIVEELYLAQLATFAAAGGRHRHWRRTGRPGEW